MCFFQAKLEEKKKKMQEAKAKGEKVTGKTICSNMVIIVSVSITDSHTNYNSLPYKLFVCCCFLLLVCLLLFCCCFFCVFFGGWVAGGVEVCGYVCVVIIVH